MTPANLSPSTPAERPQGHRTALAAAATALAVLTASAAGALCDYRRSRQELILPDFGVLRMKTLADGSLYFAVMSGRQARANAEVYRIDARGEAQCLTCEVPGHQRFADPSPDGRWLVFQSGAIGESGTAASARGGDVGLTQLYAMDLRSSPHRVYRLTGSGVNRIPWWSPDGQRLYWTRVEPDLTFHMWEGRFVETPDAPPRLEPLRELVPRRARAETEAERVGKRFAWYEAKGVFSEGDGDDRHDVLVFAATLKESGNTDVWRMDLRDQTVRRITNSSEYDELVQWAPNQAQFSVASSRAHRHLGMISPFSAGPPLMDPYLAAPMVSYVINLQIIPLHFDLWMSDGNGFGARQLSEADDGWHFAWTSWAPDSSRLLYTQEYKPGTLRGMLGQVRLRTWLIRFECDEPSAAWTAIERLPRFAKNPRAPAAPVRIVPAPAVPMPARVTIDENVAGAESGKASIKGWVDLARFSYDIAITYDRFLDSREGMAVSGRAHLAVSNGDSPLRVRTLFDVALRRSNGDSFETSISTRSLLVTGRSRWKVGNDSGATRVRFPFSAWREED